LAFQETLDDGREAFLAYGWSDVVSTVGVTLASMIKENKIHPRFLALAQTWKNLFSFRLVAHNSI